MGALEALLVIGELQHSSSSSGGGAVKSGVVPKGGRTGTETAAA